MSNPKEQDSIEELSVKDVLTKDQYKIPIYQRNFAWGKIEINQLLSDIKNKYEVDKELCYYIGTLTVKKNENYYEVIDGQQRLTVLNLIKIAFENEKDENIEEINLKFEARNEIEEYLKDIYNGKNNSETDSKATGINNINFAIGIIKTFIKENNLDNKYRDFLFNNVKIIRIEVPEKTDLNKYFEIMNTRGQQLESHEVLKARLMEKLKNKSCIFNKIWTACSDMDNYAMSSLKDFTTLLEFSNVEDLENKIEKIFSYEDEQNNNDIAKKEFSEILKSSENDKYTTKEKKENDENIKYSSIIDFPNFLLQVLKLTTENISEDISLDDKKLLTEFSKFPKANDQQFEEKFIKNLLKYRILFDKFIIKRNVQDDNSNNKWSIISLKKEKEKYSYINTFTLDDIGSENIEDENTSKKYSQKNTLVMLQSMLEVSESTKTNKNWLFNALKYFDNLKENVKYGEAIKDALWKYSRKKINEINLEEHYKSGTSTPHFIFNYLDFIIWYEDIKGNNEKLKHSNSVFQFSYNNSVEHVYPRNPDGEESLENLVDTFGNLCLISKSDNSKYSNLPFSAKKDKFLKSKIASLKQALIFLYNKWEKTEIEEHEKCMKELIEKYRKLEQLI